MKKIHFLTTIAILSTLFIGCGEPIGPKPIHKAAEKGNIAGIERELKKGVDINVRYKSIRHNDTYTPLKIAIIENKLEAVKYLVKNGAVYQADALCAVAEDGNLETLKFFIEEEHVDINYNKCVSGKTLFEWALFTLPTTNTKMDEKIKYLIKSGAEFDESFLAYKIMQKQKSELGEFFIEQKVLSINDIKKAAEKIKKDFSELSSHHQQEQGKYYEPRFKFAKEFIAHLQAKEEQEKRTAIEDKVAEFEKNQDYTALKNYTDQNPNSAYYIQNREIRLALTGPKGMKVGDIRKLLKSGRDEKIVVSLIKRVKAPYKEYTLDEIDTLTEMGFSANVISAMIDVTTELLKDQQRREEQKFLLAEQERIAKENAQTKTVYKEKTQQNSAGNQLMDTVGKEVGKQIGKELGKKLLDQLF